jgi:hypothetical protein
MRKCWAHVPSDRPRFCEIRQDLETLCGTELWTFSVDSSVCCTELCLLEIKARGHEWLLRHHDDDCVLTTDDSLQAPYIYIYISLSQSSLLSRSLHPIGTFIKRLRMSKVTVHISYCGSWGYAPRYKQLAEEIKAAVPGADVSGTVGKRGKLALARATKQIICEFYYFRWLWDYYQWQACFL